MSLLIQNNLLVIKDLESQESTMHHYVIVFHDEDIKIYVLC